MTESTFSTALTKVNDSFFPMIEKQLTGNGIKMDNYSKQCVLTAISSINNVLDSKGITWNDADLDKNNITQILISVASLKLNAAASPREVYFQTRNVSVKKQGTDDVVWKKQIEMGIEGDGNDAILSNFGRDVQSVAQIWLVRSEDAFTYPSFRGLKLEPPTWSPTGKGEVVRVVYPVIKKNNTVEYHISEREDVIKNLVAHINNNMMNETFGIAQNRFKATFDEKKKIAKKKSEVLSKVKAVGLAALDEEEFAKWISPAWKDPQSRESMLIRKMRNNVTKRIPKDFGNAFVEMNYEASVDEGFASARQEITDNANDEIIDVDYEDSTTNSYTDQPETEQYESQEEVKEESQSEKEPVKTTPANDEPPF
ncbi:hypothetical protein [Alkalicoccobacillus plakortidis]|uniref:RecT family protein n=1 Tax=Alkalicoccobacillus plakortidis TaxID=444060 RepID=A0ABT0XDQ9_9BACI|nr:hypothetical protein [Alkalicoccobacillus plakortidis]MCM2674057.1 hypothetical protein [Alkalicoccobacillus plakortidis]